MNIPSNDILDAFSPITLSEMDAVRLLNRIDTKYLTDESVLLKVLERALEKGYFIFEGDDRRVIDYRSMYYDTDNLQMYLDHHDRHLTRQKVRTRCYTSSGVTFLELKNKNNHGRTKKKRLEISPDLYLTSGFEDANELEWLSDKLTYPLESLSPSLETLFSRITLVNPAMTERTTMDMSLSFRNMRNGKISTMGRLAVIEVKQDGNADSPLRDILLDLRVKKIRISKYCIGTAMTSDTVKYGRFKKKLLLIDKMNDNI